MLSVPPGMQWSELWCQPAWSCQQSVLPAHLFPRQTRRRHPAWAMKKALLCCLKLRNESALIRGKTRRERLEAYYLQTAALSMEISDNLLNVSEGVPSLFGFFVIKALPQLHFVLIIKSGFVFIMTNGGSCHYQQTVLRYDSKTLPNSPAQPMCSHQRNSHYLFAPLFSFCCCCKLSAMQQKPQCALPCD